MRSVMADALYAPLLRGDPDTTGWVLGRAAQSLDGFIATRSGASRWISGPDDLRHTHRLRALCDAVVVGAGTVRADDPRLTTRLCPGPSPVRVVIDTRRRLPSHHRVFDGAAPSLLLATQGEPGRHGGADIVVLPGDDEAGLAPAAIVAALAARGLRRLLIEGGGRTLSRFLLAGALDRLHVTVAPLLLGGGIPALPLPPAAEPSSGLRFGWTAHRMGADILLDIPLSSAAVE
jgi:riboflavin-specific deaminase-like protein